MTSQKNTKHRICLVICYFGTWPTYFPFFLKSCASNPEVDFLFFTDCEVPTQPSPNLKFIRLDLLQFKQLATRKLGLNVKIKRAFKVCDFRPAYGIIFDEYLGNYDFWGHTDIDLIFGQIKTFITDDILGEYEVITSRKEHITGHFTLYKNTDKINRLFEQSADYKMIFENERYYSFDENSYLWTYLIGEGGTIYDKNPTTDYGNKMPVTDSMTHVVKRLSDQNKVRAYFKTMIKEGYDLKPIMTEFAMCWADRLMLVNTKEEILYFHFHRFKVDDHFLIPDWQTIPDCFFITRHGFLSPEQIKFVES